MVYTMKILCTFFLLVPLIYATPQVPCYFIFGDSLWDSGNNNFLNTTAKANFPPYGVDYPHGVATGRFTNGRTIADIITEFLGFSEHVPPFATARGGGILRGVNYASGGAGILKDTGRLLGEVISLDQQMTNHRTTVNKITGVLRNRAMNYLNKCIYTVGLGSNDYLNNYFAKNASQSSKLYTPNRFAQLLINQYSNQLRTLYKLGARKVALFGLGPIGCIPAELKITGHSTSCWTEATTISQVFSKKLKPLVDQLNKDLPGAKFIFVDPLEISLTDPASNGFKFPHTPCCKASTSTGLCLPHQVPCGHETDFAFFDAFHPTESANMMIARRAYRAQLPQDTYPNDISHLTKV